MHLLKIIDWKDVKLRYGWKLIAFCRTAVRKFSDASGEKVLMLEWETCQGIFETEVRSGWARPTCCRFFHMPIPLVFIIFLIEVLTSEVSFVCSVFILTNSLSLSKDGISTDVVHSLTDSFKLLHFSYAFVTPTSTDPQVLEGRMTMACLLALGGTVEQMRGWLMIAFLNCRVKKMVCYLSAHRIEWSETGWDPGWGICCNLKYVQKSVSQSGVHSSSAFKYFWLFCSCELMESHWRILSRGGWVSLPFYRITSCCVEDSPDSATVEGVLEWGQEWIQWEIMASIWVSVGVVRPGRIMGTI